MFLLIDKCNSLKIQVALQRFEGWPFIGTLVAKPPDEAFRAFARNVEVSLVFFKWLNPYQSAVF
jgi:hypothetical protein